MYLNCTLAFQESYRLSYAELGRNGQAHMNVIWHGVTFQYRNSPLPTQFAENWTNPSFQLSIDDFLPVFGYNHNMILTVPPYMGQTLPIVHRLLLCTPMGQGEVYTIALYPGTLEAKRVTRPEAVVLVS